MFSQILGFCQGLSISELMLSCSAMANGSEACDVFRDIQEQSLFFNCRKI